MRRILRSDFPLSPTPSASRSCSISPNFTAIDKSISSATSTIWCGSSPLASCASGIGRFSIPTIASSIYSQQSPRSSSLARIAPSTSALIGNTCTDSALRRLRLAIGPRKINEGATFDSKRCSQTTNRRGARCFITEKLPSSAIEPGLSTKMSTQAQSAAMCSSNSNRSWKSSPCNKEVIRSAMTTLCPAIFPFSSMRPSA